jgi:hypothetical protein
MNKAGWLNSKDGLESKSSGVNGTNQPAYFKTHNKSSIEYVVSCGVNVALTLVVCACILQHYSALHDHKGYSTPIDKDPKYASK